MANEITLSLRLQAAKPAGVHLLDFNPGALRYDLTGNNADSKVTSVGTTAAALSISADIGTEGYAYFRNLDGTNYLELGVDVAGTFYPLVKLKPNRAAVFPLAIQGIYARANTAACRLQWGVLED